MKTLKQVRGMTLMGFVMVMAVVGFFAFLGMKIGPAYLEYYNVLKAMKGVAAQPGAVNWSSTEVYNALEKRLDLNYVSDKRVNKRNFEIKKKGTTYTMRVKYERRENIMYNLDYIASFDKSMDIGGRSVE